MREPLPVETSLNNYLGQGNFFWGINEVWDFFLLLLLYGIKIDDVSQHLRRSALWLENIDYYLYDIFIFRKWIPKWPIQIIKSSLTKILLRICLGKTKANQANDYWKLVLCHPRNGDYEVLFRIIDTLRVWNSV